MSAADLMAVLLDGYLRLNYDRPGDPHNDHLIFSKGHASPLYYSMLKAAGAVSEDEFRPRLRFYGPVGRLEEDKTDRLLHRATAGPAVAASEPPGRRRARRSRPP